VLPPNSSRTATIAFTPSTLWYREAVLTILDDAQGGLQTFPLTGFGLPAAVSQAVSPISVDFGFSPIGVPANAPTPIQFFNYGNGWITLSGLTFSGPNAADFHIYQNNCGALLFPGAGGSPLFPPFGSACDVQVQFTPSVSGPEYAFLSLANNSPIGPITVQVEGFGEAVTSGATVAPPVVDFNAASSVYGSASVRVINSATGPLSILSAAVTGPDAASFAIGLAGDGCSGQSLLTLGSCSISLAFFAEDMNQPKTASLVVATTNGNLTVPLLGSYPVLASSYRYATPVTVSAPAGTTVEYDEVIYEVGTFAAPLSPDTPAFLGADAADFTLGNVACDATSTTCTLPIQFTPGGTGSRTATLSLNGGSVLIPINGTGN
jgi:hypothetical protein